MPPVIAASVANLAGGMAGGVNGRLTDQIAGKVQAGEEQADGNGRPGQGGKVVEGLQIADYAGIFLLPGLSSSPQRNSR